METARFSSGVNKIKQFDMPCLNAVKRYYNYPESVTPSQIQDYLNTSATGQPDGKNSHNRRRPFFSGNILRPVEEGGV
jgi:hypothetical protein